MHGTLYLHHLNNQLFVTRFLIILLLLSVSFSCGLFEEDQSVKPYTAPQPLSISEEKKKEYNAILQHYFDSTLLSPSLGFSGGILVAKGGTILFEHYQGYEDYPGRTKPLTSSSSLHIASSTKPFTAIAILTLVQEKKLALTDSLSRFFPSLPYPGLTIRDLLSHRSGLPNYLYFMEEVIKNNNGQTTREKQRMVSNQDVLNTLISARPPAHAAPNTRFEYCNTNYVLLALLIEKISGMSFPVYMKKYFFDRLSMHNTFVYQPQDSLRSTPSYQPNGARWSLDYLDQTYGDKNIYSTPQDLLKWDQALYTDQLIDTSLLQQAFSGYSFERAGTHNYGLGFRLSLLPNGKKIVYHFGRWHGNNAAFTRLLNEKVVIIIIGNRFNRSIYSAAHNSYDLFGSYFKRDAEEEDP